MLARFNKIKEDHQKRIAAHAAQSGKLETYYEQLQALGHTTLKSAKNDLRSTQAKISQLDAEIDELLTEYEEEFEV